MIVWNFYLLLLVASSLKTLRRHAAPGQGTCGSASGGPGCRIPGSRELTSFPLVRAAPRPPRTVVTLVSFLRAALARPVFAVAV